jgi:hypothetical protein
VFLVVWAPLRLVVVLACRMVCVWCAQVLVWACDAQLWCGLAMRRREVVAATRLERKKVGGSRWFGKEGADVWGRLRDCGAGTDGLVSIWD